MTVVRLAYGGPAKAMYKAFPVSTDVRLAIGANCGPPHARGLAPNVGSSRLPALLVSYFYVKNFDKERHNYAFRNWSMDSGAFSAANSGSFVDFDAYMDECEKRLEEDDQLTEVFSLDVIGDWEASARNTETMWARGIPAIPVYHYGSPIEALHHMSAEYPKISLGGAVGLGIKVKVAWAQACMAHVWPKLVHGLGFGSEKMMMALPFDSTDASSWELGPNAFGNWSAFDGANLAIRGGEKNLRPQVEMMLDMEERVHARWRGVLEPLRAMK